MEAATAERTETFTFISRGREERLVRRPKNIVRDEFGQQRTTQEPIRVEFGPNGTYTATRGKDKLVDSESQLAAPAELERRGMPPAGEPRDEVDWLRSHVDLYTRFHEEGHEAERPLPTETDFMATVVQAVASLDVGKLEGLLEQETSTHNRDMLVQSVETAIANAREQIDRIAAQEQPQG